MTRTHVEVERKYDVGPTAQVPPLQGAPGVAAVVVDEQHLEATYHDTDDLGLLAAGTSLRRRTGGSDAGWHLKLPHGADREEVQVDGDGLQVPDLLRALVRSRTGRAALRPVARLTTERTVHRLLAADGTVLAEIADDRVTGTPARGAELAWREWEVELVDGPAQLLDALGAGLLAAGAVPSGAGSKVARVLGDAPAPPSPPPWWARRPVTSPRVRAGRVLHTHLAEQVEELRGRDPQVRLDRPDALHKMRVASRRLRSALQTFRPLLDRERTDRLRDELRWLAGVLGEVRDTEVMHERLRALVAAEPEALVVGPVQARVDAVLGERYRAGHDRVLAALESDRYLDLLEALEALLADPPLLPAARARASEVLPGLVRRSWQRLDRAARAAQAADGEERDALLHEARKDAKRARYAAEAVTAAYGRPALRWAKAVTTLQEVLGDHQDGVVTRQVLLELARAAQDAGESAFTYGRLHAREQSAADQALTRWPAALGSASRPRLRRWMTSR